MQARICGQSFFRSLSESTGVQTINYTPVDVKTSATVKAPNTEENKVTVTKTPLSLARCGPINYHYLHTPDNVSCTL